MKRANRGLLPSTHLIVNAAEGSKYTAAKKWNLPAVSKLYVSFYCSVCLLMSPFTTVYVSLYVSLYYRDFLITRHSDRG